MANEHVLLVESETPFSMTCSNSVGIERGALLKMTDPNTVAISAADNDIIAGIAAEEKIANDGKTSISVYRGGKFKAIASGNITVGNALVSAAATGGANVVAAAAVNAENIVGISSETVSTGETFEYELNPTVMNLA